MRWPLALWRKAFAPADLDKNSEQGRYASAQIARGAYLVEGAGHCGACHTPRAVTLQERALDDSSALFLAGGSLIDGWVAVNLRGNTAEGLGNWTAADIVSALRGARTVSNAVVGRPMSDVVVHSTQYLAIEDLRAIAAYLKTLPPTKNEASSFVADPATAHDLATGRDAGRGAELYVDNCAACHRTDGRGSRNAIPTIAGNSSVLAERPDFDHSPDPRGRRAAFDDDRAV
jgi:alcohol dehydrogenase (quinone), cytochrome c subunit